MSDELGNCYCGQPAQKISSGTPECWKCWNWRKLDGPAARHWEKVGVEFLSNIDMYDRTEFCKKAGLSQEEFAQMIQLADRFTAACQKMLQDRGEPLPSGATEPPKN
jgi:hypothetical protein